MGTTARVRTWRGAAAVTVSSGALEATFLPDVGMLGASLRHHGEELLALPAGLPGYRARHQAGLPLLAPWANRLGGFVYEVDGVEVDLDGLGLRVEENGLPIHGTMTAEPGWGIVRVEPGIVAARFDYGSRPDLMAAFPFPHEIGIEAAVDDSALTITTSIRPTGDRAVPVAFGWHPYLHLPRVPRRSWRLSLPAWDHLELDDRSLPTGGSVPEAARSERIADRTFDDLFALGEDRQLALEGGGRRVVVNYLSGYEWAQVFIPPGRNFVCLEPMTAPTNALLTGRFRSVPPGEVHVCRFSIGVSFTG